MLRKFLTLVTGKRQQHLFRLNGELSHTENLTETTEEFQWLAWHQCLVSNCKRGGINYADNGK